jgi:hypothetical protein
MKSILGPKDPVVLETPGDEVYGLHSRWHSQLLSPLITMQKDEDEGVEADERMTGLVLAILQFGHVRHRIEQDSSRCSRGVDKTERICGSCYKKGTRIVLHPSAFTGLSQGQKVAVLNVMRNRASERPGRTCAMRIYGPFKAPS